MHIYLGCGEAEEAEDEGLEDELGHAGGVSCEHEHRALVRVRACVM